MNKREKLINRLTRLAAHPASAITSLVIMTLCLRSLTLMGYFLADDFLHIDRAKHILQSDLAGLVTAFELQSSDLSLAWYTNPEMSIRYFRPVSTALFVLDYALWGFKALGFHSTNLLVHLFNVLLVYSLARMVLADKLKAWLAGLVFLIHPATCEAVSWVSARTELLLTLFFLTAMICAVKLHELLLSNEQFPKRQTSERVKAALLFIGAMGSLTLSLFSKETAVVFPVLFLLLLYVKAGTLSLNKTSTWFIPGCSVVVMMVYGWLRISLLGGGGTGTFPPSYFVSPTDWRFVPIYLYKTLIYLGFFLFGYQIEPFYLWQFFLNRWYLMVPLIIAGTFIVHRVWTRLLAGSRVRWLLLWLPVALAPSALVFLGKRFVYLPLVGFSLVAAELAMVLLVRTDHINFGRLKVKGPTFCIIVAGYFATATFLDDMGVLINLRDVKSTIMQIVEQLPDQPQQLDVHFADLWFPLSMGLDHALRLITDNDQIQVAAWYVFPHPNMRNEIAVAKLDASTYELRLSEEGLLDSPASRFFLWGSELTNQTTTERETYTVDYEADATGLIHSLKVTLAPQSSNHHQQIFRFERFRVVLVDGAGQAEVR